MQRRLPPDSSIRATEIMRAANQLGVDVVHAHLVDGETLSRLDPELPLMVTFHNQRQSWPEGIELLHNVPDALLIGCSQVVTREIEASFPQHIARTIWNGIKIQSDGLKPELRAQTLTLVAIANPRPQKRLPLLIDVLAELPNARLKIAGEPSSMHADAQAEVQCCHEKIAAHGLEQAEFLVAGHSGSTPRPVGKVASGGELSRIALAIAVGQNAWRDLRNRDLGRCDAACGHRRAAGLSGRADAAPDVCECELADGRADLRVFSRPRNCGRNRLKSALRCMAALRPGADRAVDQGCQRPAPWGFGQ